jgi:deazaflavin-dependent oxidoreductase (nitroreductase family)
MPLIRKKSALWYFFRAPVYLYRWRLGWLLGRRCLLLTHTGRSTGLRRETVLEVVEYRKEGPEVVVVNGFGPDSDWLRNIEAKPGVQSLGAIGVAYLVQHFAPEAKRHGVPEVMEAIYYHKGVIRPVVAAIKAVASAVSIGSGGAVGREGPIIQIGAAFGSTVA